MSPSLNDAISHGALAFRQAVPTHGCGGFPAALRDVTEARRAVERERLPLIRSNAAWLAVYNRLLVAQASGTEADIEAARQALAAALETDSTPQRAA
ncbi:hypothetical protein [Methylobacterium durans]|uniref:Uncharacterized protein n=1 Tax=Methylobacterium durans TaxID=2202825 RepID=A0A2U8W6G2_9HYPH|nr:hypothetical protein [Methylobacterium durans]AWN40982.1 hypothetical protein DK389_11185 [Methylobacterium durans]